MGFWHEFKQAIETLRSEGLTNEQVTECLRGIEILETLGVQELDFVELARDQPRLEDGRAAVSRWLVELNRKIESALVGGRVLVLKTMHLTHGLREFFPFDETTTLEHVEEHLRKCYRDSIHEYITKFTADLLPDGPIRLQFYAGSPQGGVEARPLDPETRVATLPGVDTDGVYWWPQSKQLLRERALTPRNNWDLAFPEIVRDELLLSRERISLLEHRASLLEHGSWIHFESFWPLAREKKADEKRLLSDAIERAFQEVITRALQRPTNEMAPQAEEVLQSISFQIIGSIPNQKLAIRCGEEMAAVALPSTVGFYETRLMETANTEIANVTEKGGRATGGLEGHGSYHKGKSSSRQRWRNYPRRTR